MINYIKRQLFIDDVKSSISKVLCTRNVFVPQEQINSRYHNTNHIIYDTITVNFTSNRQLMFIDWLTSYRIINELNFSMDKLIDIVLSDNFTDSYQSIRVISITPTKVLNLLMSSINMEGVAQKEKTTVGEYLQLVIKTITGEDYTVNQLYTILSNRVAYSSIQLFISSSALNMKRHWLDVTYKGDKGDHYKYPTSDNANVVLKYSFLLETYINVMINVKMVQYLLLYIFKDDMRSIYNFIANEPSDHIPFGNVIDSNNYYAMIERDINPVNGGDVYKRYGKYIVKCIDNDMYLVVDSGYKSGFIIGKANNIVYIKCPYSRYEFTDIKHILSIYKMTDDLLYVVNRV